MIFHVAADGSCWCCCAEAVSAAVAVDVGDRFEKYVADAPKKTNSLEAEADERKVDMATLLLEQLLQLMLAANPSASTKDTQVPTDPSWKDLGNGAANSPRTQCTLMSHQ